MSFPPAHFPGGNISATINGQTQSFTASSVKAVLAGVSDGDNQVNIQLDLPVTVSAGSGNDSLTTGGGDDVILAGRETTPSTPATATIKSSVPAPSNITAGDGNNAVQLEDGTATIHAGTGDNSITSQQGDVTIDIAGGNNKILLGNGATNITIGGTGNNSITLSTGAAQITTGDGDDSILCSGAATISSGGGNDRIENDDTSPDSSSINGGAGNDTILGGDCDGTILGGDGNDSIRTGSGSDSLYQRRRQ